MKTQNSSLRGVALVIVLGFLVIISALSVAFFSSVTTELKASRNFSSTMSTKQLAESAVQVVMGQIREATIQPNVAWASQPGMIRTYGASGGGAASATAKAFYKLYSSPSMTAATNSDMITALSKDYDQAWDTKPALWTDLNSPVMAPDPSSSSGAKVPHFPIIDPRASGVVEGFTFSAGVNGVSTTNGNDARLPMPVSWIYVLQDGTLTAPNTGSSTGTVASWGAGGTAPGKVSPSATNPIVGRIAFWADDETSKVNINTAGGYVDDVGTLPAGYTQNSYAGSFWDTPRAYTSFDRGIANPDSAGYGVAGKPQVGGGGLAICQLLQNEFQRYPGHPGTTSLGLVFYDRSKGKSPVTSEQLYQMLPRLGTTNSKLVNPGSSMGGTNRVVISTQSIQNQNPLPDNLEIQPNRYRLFASVDELLFAPQSGGSTSTDSYARRTTDNLLGLNNQISSDFIDRMRFFLTAQSRAPELNLFGQPRVTLWPVRAESNTEITGLNPFDNVILFCSTVGPTTSTNGRQNTQTYPSGSPLGTGAGLIQGAPGGPYRYIFTRREIAPVNMTNNTVSSLATNTIISGAWQPDINWARNKQLMLYLYRLASTPIPGVGGNSFVTKYGQLNMDQTLTEIFDYCRCPNLQDTTTYAATGNKANQIQFSPSGVVMPTRQNYLSTGNNFLMGFGRFPTLCEASLVFYYAGPVMDPLKPTLVAVDSTTGIPKAKKIKAFLLLSTFNPMQGYAPLIDPIQSDPKVSYEITGLNAMTITDSPPSGLGFTAQTRSVFDANDTVSGGNLKTVVYRSSGGAWGGRNFGGFEGFMHTLVGQGLTWAPAKIKKGPEAYASITQNYPAVGYDNSTAYSASFNDGVTASGASVTIPTPYQEWYQFQTSLPNGFIFPASQGTFLPTAAPNVVLLIKYGGQQVQTINLNFSVPTGGFPLPFGDPQTNLKAAGLVDSATSATQDASGNPIGLDPSHWPFIAGLRTPTMQNSYWEDTGSFYPWWKHSGAGVIGTKPTYVAEASVPSPFVWQARMQGAWSFSSRLAWSMQNSYAYYQNSAKQNINHYANRWKQILQPGDTIRSLIYCTVDPSNAPAAIRSGDLRIASVSDTIASGDFQPHPDYNTTKSRACNLRLADGTMYFPPGSPAMNSGSIPNLTLTVATDAVFGNHVQLSNPNKMPVNRAMGNLPYVPGGRGVNGVLRWDQNPGDFDTGVGNFPDGPYANKQDEGNVIYAYQDPNTGQIVYPVPYFGTWAYEAPGNTFTSPSRQVPSAVMMGSLPSKAGPGAPPIGRMPWETLCFCPNPAGANHNGLTSPKDHLLLDLFQMPVVEPYPISEPFSTAGKINLNYAIAPFDYITRSTAVRAALHPLRVMVIPTNDYLVYKSGGPGTLADGSPTPLATNYRLRIDRDQTIAQFDALFSQGKTDPSIGFFKSASQICEEYLYPIGTSYGQNMANYWATSGALSGDNVREKPYADLYPRVTTKSNTYCVHFRVQTLRQLPRDGSSTSNTYAQWNEGRDQVLGEYRGSTIIERYIDPSDARFAPAGTYIPDTMSLEPLYRFRSVNNKKFSP